MGYERQRLIIGPYMKFVADAADIVRGEKISYSKYLVRGAKITNFMYELVLTFSCR